MKKSTEDQFSIKKDPAGSGRWIVTRGNVSYGCSETLKEAREFVNWRKKHPISKEDEIYVFDGGPARVA